MSEQVLSKKEKCMKQIADMLSEIAKVHDMEVDCFSVSVLFYNKDEPKEQQHEFAFVSDAMDDRKNQWLVGTFVETVVKTNQNIFERIEKKFTRWLAEQIADALWGRAVMTESEMKTMVSKVESAPEAAKLSLELLAILGKHFPESVEEKIKEVTRCSTLSDLVSLLKSYKTRYSSKFSFEENSILDKMIAKFSVE